MMQQPQGPTVYGPGHPMIAGPGGSVRSVSSFGPAMTEFGGAASFRAHELVNSQRVQELDYRERFYRCTQHDGKLFDFNGALMRNGPAWQTQQIVGGTVPTFNVPLSMRRPSAPYRLARVIVNSFTSMVFGHRRWPSVRVVGDPKSQDFAEALVKAAKLPTVMLRARNIGGSVGTVGLSWRFFEGKPRVLAHNGKHLHVHVWKDREELIPEHVSELFQTARDEFNPRTGKLERNWYWHRRDWTPTADITFAECRVTKEEPVWVVDEAQSFEHGDGFTHFVWVQNLPEDDPASIDGAPDYAELYENFNSIDVLNSVVVKGGTLNLDPTLVVKTDRSDPRSAGQVVRKGSDNSIWPGVNGDAHYMELAGSSLTAGTQLCDKERAQALEVAQCVIADPDQVVAAGTSSVALRMIYHPMLGKCDVLRTQYGTAIERLLEQMIASARRHLPELDAEGNEVYEVEVDEETGAEVTVENYLALPPRVVAEDVHDEHGNPTGEINLRLEKRRPGEGGDVELEWGDYFPSTETDRQAMATTLSMATGGKPVISHKRAVEAFAVANGLDPTEEWQSVAKQLQAQAAAQAEMFPSTGGPVGGASDLPDGARPEEELSDVEERVPEEPEPKPEPATLADLKAVITVNELRARAVPPLPPLPEPDGSMTVAEFEAARKARGAEAGKVVGAAAGKVEAEAIAPTAPAPAAPAAGGAVPGTTSPVNASSGGEGAEGSATGPGVPEAPGGVQ